jgi:hypothetical protein
MCVTLLSCVDRCTLILQWEFYEFYRLRSTAAMFGFTYTHTSYASLIVSSREPLRYLQLVASID